MSRGRPAGRSSGGTATARPRHRVALAVLLGLALLSPPIVWLAAGGREDDGLTVARERLPTGMTEIVLSVRSGAEDELDAPARGTLARVECRDRPGALVLRTERPWPFATDGDAPAAHEHLPVSDAQGRRVASCRVAVGESALEGEIG